MQQGVRSKIHGNPLITLLRVQVEVGVGAAGAVEEAAEGEQREGQRGAVLEEDTQQKDWANQGEWRQNENFIS